MRYAFVIDDRRCIGCHACSIACKTENDVPLGVFRTWVKYVETGTFPATRRHFQVTRCNHCANPPCVAICPVAALVQRADGVVDFDSRRCIGCKACMQACPYDSIHVDPARGTAAKCNFCAHRLDVGLAPVCAAVCPTQAILAGDLGDATGVVGRALAGRRATVRKPEQRTRPMLFYLDAEPSAFTPGVATPLGAYLWAEENRELLHPRAPLLEGVRRDDACIVYDVEHARPWGWQIPAYFWTKSIAAGMLMPPALLASFGPVPIGPRPMGAATAVSLAFVALTVALLVGDLGRPERFVSVLTRGARASWLVRGAWIMGLFFFALGGALACAALGHPVSSRVLAVGGALGGAAVAGYTGLLLRQCEGRDLWQSRAVTPHLVVQALVAGTAAWLLAPAGAGIDRAALGALLIAALGVHGALIVAELAPRGATAEAERAARSLTRGAYRAPFFGVAIALGIVVPLLVLGAIGASSAGAPLAGLTALVGLAGYEWCFVMGAQSVPNS